MPRRVVILGAGFGGLSAARELDGAPVEVAVVDRRNHHLFQPLLYQVAIRSILRRQANARVLLAEAVGIDAAAREVLLADGRLPYDYLIVATGARHAYFGHDEWEPYAPGLKTLEDAIEIRRRILLAFEKAERETDPARRRTLLTFVLVGGGPTGAELAGAIAEIARHVLVFDFRSIDPRDARIVLAEAGPRILPAFPEQLSRKAQAELAHMGVEVRTSAAVTDIAPGAVVVGGERIAAETILWTAGVLASPLARSLGVPLDRAGRVPVGPDLSIPGHPEIFVIGDLARFTQPDGEPLPGVAQPAIQEGRHAALNIRLALAGRPPLAFQYRNLGNLAVLGRSAAVADLPWLRFSGYPAWVFWCFVHIMKLVGFRSRLLVFLEWAWSYVTWQRGARLITGGDEDTAGGD
jgi:NADH dehydrogenase